MRQPESPIFLDEAPGQAAASRLAFFRNLLMFGMVAALSVCGLALIAFVVIGAQMNDRTDEIAALQDSVQFVQEFRDLRARGADNNAWAEFEVRVMNRMQEHADKLVSRASVSRPVLRRSSASACCRKAPQNCNIRCHPISDACGKRRRLIGKPRHGSCAIRCPGRLPCPIGRIALCCVRCCPCCR
jgi:hypothetical protein